MNIDHSTLFNLLCSKEELIKRLSNYSDTELRAIANLAIHTSNGVLASLTQNLKDQLLHIAAKAVDMAEANKS